MPQRRFRHLPPRRRKHRFPPNIFGLLVGQVDGPLDDSNDNHVTIPLRVTKGPATGLYRVAVNIASTGLPKSAQYFIRDEPVPDQALPRTGIDPEARLSYDALGLQEANFTTLDCALMRAVMHESLAHADVIAAYGVTFSPYGLHDIHYNNGELPGSLHENRPDRDGAISLFFRDKTTGHLIRRWIFIKFQSQRLASSVLSETAPPLPPAPTERSEPAK
jgi:hypothetical protein